MVKIQHRLEYLAFKGLELYLVSNNLKNSSDKGAGLGSLCAKFGIKRSIALTNLARAFPDHSKEDNLNIYRRALENIGRNLAEASFFMKNGFNDSDFTYEIRGKDHLINSKNSGRPIIFFSGHISNWEMLPWVVKEAGLPFAPMFRRPNNPLMNNQLMLFRKNILQDIPIFSKSSSGARAAFRYLLEKKYIGILGDQKTNNGIESPLFKYPAMTSEATAALALRSKAIIVPGVMRRSIKGQRLHYTLEVSKPIEATEVSETTNQLNSILERWIERDPSEWLWIHRRWDKSIYRN